MLKKEFKEVSKQSLFFVVFVIGIPVLVSMLSMLFKWSLTYNEIFFPVYQVGMFIFAVVTGLTLFSAERRQGGMEYLLTLPLSRMRLLGIKVLPRVVALGVFSILFWLLLHLYSLSSGKGVESLLILPTHYIAYLALWIFIISVSFSAFHDNIILLALGILLIFGAYSLLMNNLQTLVWQVFGKYLDMNFLLFAVLSISGFLIPFAVPFVLAFRKFDLHPAGRFNRKYLKIFVPIFIICLFISAFFVYSGVAYGYDYKLYYLASNHKLIEFDWKTTYIYDRDTRTELPSGDVYPWMCFNKCDCGGWLYLKTRSGYDQQYIRLNIADNSVETLYTLKGPSFYRVWDYWFFKDRLVFFEGSYSGDNLMLVVVNVETKAAIKINLPAPLQEKYRTMQVVGAVEDNGTRSWLVFAEKASKGPLYRVWEDGSSRDLGLKGRSPHYINGILISLEKEGMVFSRLTAAGCEVIKIDPNGKAVKIGQFYRMDLDNARQKEVFGLRYGEEKVLMKIDLENLEVTKVKEFRERPIYLSHQECIVLEGYPNAGKLYRILGNGQIELMRTFSGFNAQEKGNYFHHCVNGIVTRENGKVSVYAFPKMEELPFKKLN
ncbi:MAG: hypothetical protein QG657_1004 [Acidobacteriota bacterium]|nr:hypothetical protein [Acidobacteriota bacterium]